ncbi:Oidioi.mRNA.OKI2018_I69.chr1.g755.t1.cds [Oikopleura dioica]|uniref:Oidioi.mRNA.OKI2018_I69.chr1.g755.t1.cds n=1 Tax=Oikopleura dioica TaxID=34765 RepID=A0ABN7SQ25_OIKDI|nr:Oidioi.mRNA.OKI2018_I69.chr1.g755.t1.cds [Oikopleura dioica]
MEGGSSLLKMECLAENEEGCALPENLENGFFHCPNGHFANSRCQIICNNGFSLPSGTRSAVKCTKRLAWNADIENIRCQPVFGSGGERGIVMETGSFCDAPEISQENFVGEFECESGIYADRSKCLLKCPQGYVSQTKSPKQNWKKCRCKKSGECRWSREQSIGCVKLGGTVQKPETSNRLEGRRKKPSPPVISNLLSDGIRILIKEIHSWKYHAMDLSPENSLLIGQEIEDARKFFHYAQIEQNNHQNEVLERKASKILLKIRTPEELNNFIDFYLH